MPDISVDFWKGQPAGGSEGHTFAVEDDVSVAHTRPERKVNKTTLVPRMTKTRRIRIKAEVRKRYVSIYLDLSFHLRCLSVPSVRSVVKSLLKGPPESMQRDRAAIKPVPWPSWPCPGTGKRSCKRTTVVAAVYDRRNLKSTTSAVVDRRYKWPMRFLHSFRCPWHKILARREESRD